MGLLLLGLVGLSQAKTVKVEHLEGGKKIVSSPLLLTPLLPLHSAHHRG